MATSAVRKSSRIKTRKKFYFENDDLKSNKTNHMSDISKNISSLLSFHSKENDDVKLLQSHNSFPNVAKRIYGKHKMHSKSSNMSHDERHGPDKVNGKDISLFKASMSYHLQSSNNSFSELFTSDDHGKDSSKKNYYCDQCDKSFSDVAAFKRHLKWHTGDRPFKCDQCEKSFTESCSLKRHVKIHEDERPFACDICFKSFRDSTSFNRHQLTHVERPRSYQCPHCEKNFTDKSGLKRHERTHSGLRPYECSVCYKTFSESGSFRRHQKIHIGVRNHHCPRCKRSFMEKQSLIRHQKTVCGFWESAPTEVYQDFETNSEGEYRTGSFYSDGHEISNSDPKSMKKDDLPSASFFTPLTVNNEPNSSNSSFTRKVNKESQKCSPSLVSLIQRDPNLYDSISEIVDSIDSYEKMLDLCGDNGQKEIDKALTKAPVSMPDNLMCFECGEVLVNGENFNNEGKSFTGVVSNSFRCLSCEEDEEKYGEPPTLTAEYTEHQEEQLYHIKVKDYQKEAANSTKDHEYLEVKLKLRKTSHSETVDSERSTSCHENIPYKINASRSKLTAPHCENIKRTEDENFIHPAIPGLSPIKEFHSDQVSLDNISTMEYEADDPSIPSVFPCHLCTKVFATSAFLERHLDLHRKSPFKCMVCNKSFNGNPALKRHMRVHTGEKPYSCPLCKKKFRDPSNFGKHKKFCSSVNGFVPSPVDSNSSNMSSMSVEENLDEIKRNTKGDCVEDKGENTTLVQIPIKGESINSSNISPLFSEEFTKPFMAVIPSIDDLEDNSLDSDQCLNEEIKISYIPCEICQKLCENQQHLEMHMNFHRGNPDVTCIECGKSFSDCHGLKRHMRIHSDSRPFTCDYCNRGYCDNWSLKKHKSRGCMSSEVLVPVDFLHPCQHCCRVFSEADLLEDHVKCHQGKLKFECDICFKQFSEAFNFRRHRRLHMAICPSCGKEFKDIKDMTKHQENSCFTSLPVKSEDKLKKKFPCPDCGRTYSTQAYLERHRKFHSDVKPYACEICNKKFAEAFRLRRHKKAHTKPFICQECGRGFSDEAHLKRHIINSSCTVNKTIHGAVDFPCQYCDKVFSKNYMLVRHMNVHSQERPFSCDICGRSYKDTSSLKRHSLIHQGVKDFICSICGKDFFYADSLKRHMSGRCSKNLKAGGHKSRKARKRNGLISKPQKNVINNHKNHSNYKESIHSCKNKTKHKRKDTATEVIVKSLSHTKPYVARSVDFVNISSIKSKNVKLGPWSCLKKKHCWQCDIRLPSAKALFSHVKIHHHKKKFPCHHCYIRFSCKAYWRIHQPSCKLSSNLLVTKKMPMKPSPAPLEERSNKEEKRRPRRSIPRARWSWLTQI